jgi:hypothetical protein
VQAQRLGQDTCGSLVDMLRKWAKGCRWVCSLNELVIGVRPRVQGRWPEDGST